MSQLEQVLETALSVLEPVPEALRGWLLLVLAIVLWLLVARVVEFFMIRYARRLVKRTSMTLDDEIVGAARIPVPVLVLTTTIHGTLAFLADQGLLEPLSPAAVDAIQKAIWTGALVVIALSSMRLLNLIISSSVEHLSERYGIGPELIPLVRNSIRLGVLLVFLIVLLGIWGQPIGPLITSAGLVGAALAFAARESLANLFGGVSLLMEGSIKLGDYVVLDNGERGEVVQIGIRSTQLKTRDDVQITIPNGIMANSMITNQSAPWQPFRVRIGIGTAYGCDVEHVERVLVGEAQANEIALDSPEPRVRLRRFGDSALEFELLAWCRDPAQRGILVHDLSKAIYKACAREGIEIPFPQRDVRIISSDGADA